MTDKVTPLRPQDMQPAAAKVTPDFVIKAVNELLSKGYSTSSNSITLRQCDIADAIMSASPEPLDRGDVFELKLLDFEATFIEAGWGVYYDKPAYNETYEPTFKFNLRGKS